LRSCQIAYDIPLSLAGNFAITQKGIEGFAEFRLHFPSILVDTAINEVGMVLMTCLICSMVGAF